MDLLSPQVLALGAIACLVITFVVKFMKKDSEDLGIVKKETMRLVDIEGDIENELEEYYEEAPVVVTSAQLMRMTKVQIDAHGRTQGIELDRRMTKANMIADLAARSE
tara:strand:- start:1063 stop:1386 length:324 start_codon:yes stop_codon:yes gene_type:complete